MNTDFITINTHSSIRISGEKILYFDPWQFRDSPHDADIIFVTHDHYDHFSPEDIAKIKKDSTKLVAPATTKDHIISDSGISSENLIFVKPFDSLSVCGVNIETIPAYNPNKKFHPKENNWVGYIAQINGSKILVTGDTDITPELVKVQCDISLTPIGGTYTMTAKEASEAVCKIKPALAIPTHYGNIVGELKDGLVFKELVEKAGITVDLKIQ